MTTEPGSEMPDTARSHDTGYTFNEAEALVVLPALETGFSNAEGYLEAHRQVREILICMLGRTPGSQVNEVETGPEAEPAFGDQLFHELDRALLYEFVVPFGGPVTCDLGHPNDGGPHVWPPRIQDVTEAVANLWEFLANQVQAPGARARFHDLAYLRGRERLAHAVSARDSYLEFAALSPVVDMDQGHALLRAWALDRMFGRAFELGQSREALWRALDRAWDEGVQAAGVLLPMLGALCQTQLPAEEDPVPVDELLARASDLFRFSDSVGEIAALRRGRATTMRSG